MVVTMRATPYMMAVWALSAAAQNNGLPSAGPYKPGIGTTPEALLVSEAAGRNPNLTSEVSFTRTYNNTPETWVWRVNISEVAIPNRASDLGQTSANSSEGLRIANTQWQLEWPGNNGSLKSFLDEREMSVSFTALVSNKPSNITDRYNDQDNGNCTALLGDQCTQSLQHAAARGTPIAFLSLEGCQDSLNVGDGRDAGSSFGSNTSTLEPGDTLFYRASKAYTAGNSTQLQRSESALQLLIMNFEYGNVERGDSSGPTVLCRIVSQDPSAPSAASKWRHGSTMLWGTALFSVLVTVAMH